MGGVSNFKCKSDPLVLFISSAPRKSQQSFGIMIFTIQLLYVIISHQISSLSGFLLGSIFRMEWLNPWLFISTYQSCWVWICPFVVFLQPSAALHPGARRLERPLVGRRHGAADVSGWGRLLLHRWPRRTSVAPVDLRLSVVAMKKNLFVVFRAVACRFKHVGWMKSLMFLVASLLWLNKKKSRKGHAHPALHRGPEQACGHHWCWPKIIGGSFRM